MSAIFGFYCNKKLKVMHHQGVGNPKVVGHDLITTIGLAHPYEILKIFESIILVHASKKPNEFHLNQLREKLQLDSEKGFVFNKPIEELKYQEILGEVSEDVLRYFILMRHIGLIYMLDGFENIKTWGVCEWGYIYNIDEGNLEVWHSKEEEPKFQELILTDDLDRMRENFYLVHSMIHDPQDPNRNEFTKEGMDFAYHKVYG